MKCKMTLYGMLARFNKRKQGQSIFEALKAVAKGSAKSVKNLGPE